MLRGAPGPQAGASAPLGRSQARAWLRLQMGFFMAFKIPNGQVKDGKNGERETQTHHSHKRVQLWGSSHM